MSSLFHIYRVYKFSAKEVWSCQIPDEVAVLLQESDFETLKEMFNEDPPYVFTKRATPFLAHQFLASWNVLIPGILCRPIRNKILAIIEAYPASYHHAASQEMGIGFGINGNKFDGWPYYEWRMVHEYGAEVSHRLTKKELTTQKIYGKPRPVGVPNDVWREIPWCKKVLQKRKSR